MRPGALHAFALALALALVACSRGDDQPGPAQPIDDLDLPVKPSRDATPAARGPAVTFQPDGRPPVRIAVELAIGPRDIQRGLMYREHLPPDGGMLFVFKGSKEQHFWMKNTLIPLDMIFVTADFVVAGVVANTTPKTLDSRYVEAESRFVLEVNAGWAAAHGITKGTRAVFDDVPVERAVVE